MAIDRSAMKKQLAERNREAYESKDDSGRYKSFLANLFGRPKWKCSEDEHTIDILPWVCGPNMPLKNGKVIPEGTWCHYLDIFVHYKVGPNENQYICLQNNYGKPCPVCEEYARMAQILDPNNNEADKRELSALRASRRTVFAIICYDKASEEDKGPQIWEVAHGFMLKELAERSQRPRGGGNILYADPDTGKSIFFRRKGTSQFSTEYTSHEFLDRTYVIEDEILEMVPSLDQCLYIPTYEEVFRELHGHGPGESGPAPLRRRRAAEPEDSTPSRRRPRSTSAPEEGRSAPPSRRASAPSKSRVEEDLEPEAQEDLLDDLTEDDISQDETDAEAPSAADDSRMRPRGRGQEESNDKSSKCPGGGTFGVDIDKLDACAVCEVYDPCGAREEELAAEARKKDAPAGRRRRG